MVYVCVGAEVVLGFYSLLLQHVIIDASFALPESLPDVHD